MSLKRQQQQQLIKLKACRITSTTIASQSKQVIVVLGAKCTSSSSSSSSCGGILKMRSISAICSYVTGANFWPPRWPQVCCIKFLVLSSIVLCLFPRVPLVAAQQWQQMPPTLAGNNEPVSSNSNTNNDMMLAANSPATIFPAGQATSGRLIGAREQEQNHQYRLATAMSQQTPLATVAVDGGGLEQRAPATNSMSLGNVEQESSSVDNTATTSGSGADGRLAHFIKAHLIPLTENSQSDHKRIEALSDDANKVYRVLMFAGKVAHKLQSVATSAAMSHGDNLVPAESGLIAVRSLGGANEVPLRAAATSGLAEAVRRHSGRMLVNRLAKKTDWNALFVKLAKVFLQYFLDLILNDMFGTTGKLYFY